VKEKTHEIVNSCVPRGTAEKLARQLSRSVELVNKWRRVPEDDDTPTGTGAFNPLDLVEALQDHAFAHAPEQAHLIHRYFENRYERHFSYQAVKALSPEQKNKELSDVVREHAEFFSAVLEDLTPEQVRKEWEDVKREGEEIVNMIENGRDDVTGAKAKVRKIGEK